MNRTVPVDVLKTPVLIAGRGPVGMTLALRLAGFGVPSLIVDPVGAKVEVGSKALCMQQESLEILEHVGIGARLAREGVYWPLGRTYHKGVEVSQVRFPPAPERGYPPFVNYPQRDTEALLVARVLEEPLITNRLGWRLVDIDQGARGVTATIESPDERAMVKADFVAGCDGARSTVRKQLGFGFSGTSYAANFLLCDIHARLDFPNERRLFFDPPFNPGRTVLLHPCPDDVWHIDWQMGPGPVDIEAERANGGADRRIRAITGDTPYELLWLTTYMFRSLIADRMWRERAVLAGDAAHLFAPYGARGLNSGLADAEALAWRLAAIFHGASPDPLLETYDRERMAAARENFEITDTTARFMAPPTRGARLRRSAILHGSRFSASIRQRINAGRFYRPARLPEARPGLTGEIAPDAACAVGGRDGRLRDVIGDGFAILLFGEDAGTVAGAIKSAKALSVLPVSVLAVRQPDKTGGTQPADVLIDTAGDVARVYGFDGAATAMRAVMIRPDAYVAAVSDFGSDTAPGELVESVADAIAGQGAGPISRKGERSGHEQP